METADEVDEAVRDALEAPGPAVLEFMIEQEANVFPMIPPGASLSEPIEGEPAPPRLVPRMSGSQAVAVLLEDRLITFTRAVGLLRRRNLPVRSIAVGPTAHARRIETDHHDPFGRSDGRPGRETSGES